MSFHLNRHSGREEFLTVRQKEKNGLHSGCKEEHGINIMSADGRFTEKPVLA